MSTTNNKSNIIKCHPSIDDTTIQIVCDVSNKSIYQRLGQVLNYFGFITNLCIYNYDGKGSLSSNYSKKTNFIFISDDEIYAKIKSILSQNKKTKDDKYVQLPEKFNPDFIFYQDFFSHLGDWFNKEQFLKMVNLRLKMLEDIRCNYDYFFQRLIDLAYDSHAFEYFYFKLKLEKIQVYELGYKYFKELADELNKYLEVRGWYTRIKAQYLCAQILDFDLGDYPKATEAYKGVVGIIDDNSNFYYYYASAMMKLNNASDYDNIIISSLLKVIELDHSSYMAPYKLSRISKQSRNRNMEQKYCEDIVSVLEYSYQNGFFIDREAEYYNYAKKRLLLLKSK